MFAVYVDMVLREMSWISASTLCFNAAYCSALSAKELLHNDDFTEIKVLPGDPLLDLVLLSQLFVLLFSRVCLCDYHCLIFT